MFTTLADSMLYLYLYQQNKFVRKLVTFIHISPRNEVQQSGIAKINRARDVLILDLDLEIMATSDRPNKL